MDGNRDEINVIICSTILTSYDEAEFWFPKCRRMASKVEKKKTRTGQVDKRYEVASVIRTSSA